MKASRSRLALRALVGLLLTGSLLLQAGHTVAASVPDAMAGHDAAAPASPASEGYVWGRTVVDSEGNVGGYASLAMNGTAPCIAYADGTNDAIKYACRTGSSWQTETAGSTNYGGQAISLALDSAGQPHITHYEYSLQHLYHDGGAWQNERVDFYGGAYGEYNSLAMDSADHPHVAYTKTGTNVTLLKYAYYDGSTWHKETVDGLGDEDVGRFVSLALDADDHPHISYQDVTNYNLRYAYHDGSAWHIEVVDSGTDTGYFTSIALDSAGHPHIAYYDQGDHKVRYASYDGSTWQVETVESFLWAQYISLALDSSDHPHIGYYGEICLFDCEEVLRHAYYDGTAWQREAVENSEMHHISLAVDDQDRVHIAYYDPVNDDLRYAYSVPLSTLTNRVYLPLMMRQ